MGFSALLAISLAIGFSSAIQDHEGFRKGLSIANTEPHDKVVTVTDTVTVDDILTSASTITETASEVALKTTVCTQKCHVITLSTSARTSSSSTSPGPEPISTSCVTFYDTMAGSSETWISLSTSSSATLVTVAGTTISTPKTSSSTIPKATSTSNEESKEPCSTEITFTETYTSTWSSTLPVTTTLVRTRLSTITTAIVETYSTATGKSIEYGYDTTTATINTVSIDSTCLSPETCQKSTSTTTISTSITVVAPVPSWSHTVTESGGVVSAAATSLTPSTTSTVSSKADASPGTMKDESTSVSTAGAPVMTAGVGIGTFFGLIVALV